MKYRPPICGCRPLRVSGLIKLGRYALLIAGIQKGIEKKAIFAEEAANERERKREEAEIMAPIIAAEKYRLQQEENEAFNDWIAEQSGLKKRRKRLPKIPVEGEDEVEDEDEDEDWDEDDEEDGENTEDVSHTIPQEGEEETTTRDVAFTRRKNYIKNRQKINSLFQEVLEKGSPSLDEDYVPQQGLPEDSGEDGTDTQVQINEGKEQEDLKIIEELAKEPKKPNVIEDDNKKDIKDVIVQLVEETKQLKIVEDGNKNRTMQFAEESIDKDNTEDTQEINAETKDTNLKEPSIPGASKVPT